MLFVCSFVCLFVCLFVYQVLMTTQSVATPVGTLDKPFHLLTFKPALVIHNLLPMKISIKLDVSSSFLDESPLPLVILCLCMYVCMYVCVCVHV